MDRLKQIDRGILYMIAASFTFAFMGGFAKVLGQSIPPLEVTFFRNIFGVAIIGVALLKRPTTKEGGKLWLLIFRGSIGFLALLAYFYDMAYIPLGEAVTYNKTSPLFLAFFAWLFLGEKLNRNAILALILGFIGIVFIAKPIGGVFDKYDILGIFSGVGAALAYTAIRDLKNYYDTRTIAMSFMLAGTVGPVVLMGISQFITVPKDLDFLLAKFVMPQGIEWLYIILLGTLATASQLLMTKAYSLTKAGIVGTITYSQIVFAVIIGTLLGDKLPDTLTWIGIVMVISAGILVSVDKKLKIKN